MNNKMKKYTLLFIAIMSIGILASCNNEEKIPENSYVVNGHITGATKGFVFIKARTESGWNTIDSTAIDSISANKGHFKMIGHVDNNSLSYLTSDAFRGGIPIFIENTSIEIEINKDSIADAQIIGTKSQEIYDHAKVKMGDFDKIWQDFYYNTYRYMTDEEKAKNEEYLNTIYDSAQVQKKEFLLDHIKANTDNYAVCQIIIEQEQALGEEKMMEAYELLSDTALKSTIGNQLTERIIIIKKTAIGQTLIDFTMNDTEGNPVKLSEASAGKYLLVDFWAAWCSPCRAENPNVLANYNKYHAKGFDVLGVSFDEKEDNWLKAVKDDQLPWLQISDLKGWNNAAGKLYGIRSIPQNILLNPEGVIIAKNLRGDALGQKLEELFNQ